jgi:hypothetical protein
MPLHQILHLAKLLRILVALVALRGLLAQARTSQRHICIASTDTISMPSGLDRTTHAAEGFS